MFRQVLPNTPTLSYEMLIIIDYVVHCNNNNNDNNTCLTFLITLYYT